MHLSNLYLYNYRNYDESNFEFAEGINCVLGPNGSGKTNLLDAVYYLCLSKSANHSQDHLNIKHQTDLMIIEGNFVSENKNELIGITQKMGERKNLLHDKKIYEKISEHIGKYAVVLIAPDDTDFVNEGSEKRRKLMDGIMAQNQPNFLNDLLYYKRKVEERNKILKDFHDKKYFDKELLELYDNEITATGQKIIDYRIEFINQFLPLVSKYYFLISDNKEQINIIYESDVKNNFKEILAKNIFADRSAQRTLKGPHKDDFAFQFDGHSLKKYGSQGQKKSFLIAIKLAQFEFLQKNKSQKPILLLDDIFDKLDDTRIEKLVKMIEDNFFGQIFISDARPERTKTIFKDLNKKVKYFLTSY